MSPFLAIIILYDFFSFRLSITRLLLCCPLSLPTQRPVITLPQPGHQRSSSTTSETGFICDLSDQFWYHSRYTQSRKEKSLSLLLSLQRIWRSPATYLPLIARVFSKIRNHSGVYSLAVSARFIRHMPFRLNEDWGIITKLYHPVLPCEAIGPTNCAVGSLLDANPSYFLTP